MAEMIFAPPIAQGYPYAVQFEAAGRDVVFPAGIGLRAQVRERFTADLITELTTENGGLVVINPQTVEVRIPASATSQASSFLMLDLVRTDQPDEQYLYFLLKIPVSQTVTKPE